mmetsp:Transcript_46184/g.103850  ORF Transcript_46184/g.103850 Transcript_46184/m.103850 type:complete len:122 (+) Transcript_46184:246-611(+)
MDTLALVICLGRLLAPRTGIHHWMDADRFAGFQFKRQWLRLPRVLPESNDVFASKLIEALWEAQNGRKARLRLLLLDPRQTDLLLAACSSMPMKAPDSASSESDGEASDGSGAMGIRFRPL